MHHLLIDTCIWLDIVRDHRKRTLLTIIEELIKTNELTLIVPQIVFDEFIRNKEPAFKKHRKGSSSLLKDARELAEIYETGESRTELMHRLNDLRYRLPILSDKANDSIRRTENLFNDSKILETTEAILLRAGARALNGKAPCHTEKNSFADAVIIETYGDYIRANKAAGDRFYFVSSNITDFSLMNGNNKLPHPDLADLFTRHRSRYFINLEEAVRKIHPQYGSEPLLQVPWMWEPRSLDAMYLNIHELMEKIWYNRHQNLKYKITTGKVKLVDKETLPIKDHEKRPVQKGVWKGALASAKKVERRYGKENLGPWNDFEWGMMNGKLSALRWVLGDEWDFLDT